MTSPELLAPAGSFESLRAAVKAGCDAVYFGISDFNMRSSASVNFTIEDLPEVTKFCKENNVKTYLTVNTILYNEDLAKMREIIDAAKEAGINAIIIADVASMLYARKIGMEVHVSTQLSISNLESLKFYSHYADRVILARELNLSQIKEISEQIKKLKIKGPKGNLIKIEAFAHGALCVAVSGRCAMSLYSVNTSANKGKCIQNCRRAYKVTDTETGLEMRVDNNYVFSSADLCTIGMLPELIEAGVNSLKIEGRGRPADYVFTVIKAYREALDSIKNGTYTDKKIIKWNENLKTVFNRGLSPGLYMGIDFVKWSGIYGSKATKEKILIGIVEKYYPKINVAQVLIQAGNIIKTGEQFLITGQSTGLVKCKLDKFMVEDKEVNTAKQGDVVTFEVSERVRKGDKFFVFRDRK